MDARTQCRGTAAEKERVRGGEGRGREGERERGREG